MPARRISTDISSKAIPLSRSATRTRKDPTECQSHKVEHSSSMPPPWHPYPGMRGMDDGFIAGAVDLQSQNSPRIAAGELGEGGLIHPFDAGDMADRIVFGHIKRIVGSHDNAVRSEQIEHVS